jgi:hypothetical protein
MHARALVADEAERHNDFVLAEQMKKELHAYSVKRPIYAKLLVVGLDLTLAYGLFTCRKKFKVLTIWRAILGGIFWPLLTLLQSGPSLGLIVGLTEWGFSGAMLLLLVGKPKLWRQIAAGMIFLVFTYSIFLISMLST